MYATCLFCHASLGRNEAVEAFPVGRRLAFDAARGRLWVVCPRCARWNLSPLEARFEAVEACERAFRDTRRRVSTENVGLARLRDGTELVRVGRPLRPEFAAWRYGSQFASRRRRRWARDAAVAAAEAGAALGALAFLGLGVVGLMAAGRLHDHVTRWERERVVARVRDATGRRLLVRGEHLDHVRVVAPDAPGAWALSLRHVYEGRGRGATAGDVGVHTTVLHGEAARRAMGGLLPAVNAGGGDDSLVRLAVQRIELARHPEAYVQEALGRAADGRRQWPDRALPLDRLAPSVRLALEMATHEDDERRAMEGELAELERAWREAEEVARIADDLLLPDGVRRALARLRGAAAERPPGGRAAGGTDARGATDACGATDAH